MTHPEVLLPLSAEDSAYLWTVYCSHASCRPCVHREHGEAAWQLSAGGELPWDPLRDGPLAEWEARRLR